jgi:hypothetical protein
MSVLRLRKHLLDRLAQGVSTAGELGLALLITAGVVHCGGSTSGGGAADAAGDRQSTDAAEDRFFVEAVEAAWTDAYPIIEAPAPPPEAGADAGPDVGPDAPGPVIEAAVFPDASSDSSSDG